MPQLFLNSLPKFWPYLTDERRLMTNLHFYNTLTRTKEDFHPIDANKVRLYVYPVSDKINNAAYFGKDVQERLVVNEEQKNKRGTQTDKVRKQQVEKQGKTLKNKDQFDLF